MGMTTNCAEYYIAVKIHEAKGAARPPPRNPPQCARPLPLSCFFHSG